MSHPTPAAASSAEARIAETSERIKRNTVRLLLRGVPVLVFLAILITLTAGIGIGVLVGKLAAIVVLLGHAMMLRMAIVQPARKVLPDRTRKLLVSWYGRAVFLVGAIWGYAAFPLPMVNVFTVPFAYAAITIAVGGYAVWSTGRASQGMPAARLEKALVALAVGLALVTLALLVALAMVAGLTLQWLLDVWSLP